MEALKRMVELDPGNLFARYGLAQEYAGQGDLEAASAEFRSLLEADPGYLAAYLHYGQTLEKLGRIEEARTVYEKGLEVATQKGDLHTRSEIQAALDVLGI